VRVIQNFRYTATGAQRFVVPEGVTTCRFECWGAAGGMGSSVAWAPAKTNVLVGGSAPKNQYYSNNPSQEPQLGYSYANNGGYAAGDIATTPGEAFYVVVGGNGGPGISSVRRLSNGAVSGYAKGGAAGFNGGGPGGNAALCYQNLYNALTTKVQFTSTSPGPAAATLNDLWLDTTNNLVKRCNATYSGGFNATKWTVKTDAHGRVVGSSGGGGGGATDIRRGGDATTQRVLVAGGSGGASGTWNKTQGAPSAWALVACPTAPSPPFGADTTATGPTDTINHVWLSSINYLTGGWGRGGLGGSTSTANGGAPTASGGLATSGGAGTTATGRHAASGAAVAAAATGGGGGGPLSGGVKGVGGTGGTAGSSAQGGTGANAAGGTDDFCSGGGGGGGGYFGGGGGGHGFLNYGTSSATGATSHGGGGGGGSNFADQVVTNPVLLGGARPPYPAPSYSATDGLGGFARITYELPPSVAWTNPVTSVLGASSFNMSFRYSPAKAGGVGIDHYLVGTNTTLTATSPNAGITTITVADPTLVSFTRAFTAPAVGSSVAIFVQVVDTDGDSSGWVRQIVTGISAGATTPVTITAPTAGATFINAATVTWTIGTQTPLAAYKATLSGTDPNTGSARNYFGSGWRRGGSRVNLATDPGFAATTNVVWSSTSNANLVGNDASFGGVSGKNGKISWTLTTGLDADQHTTVFNNLIVGTAYRAHLGIASALANDTRQFQLMVWDSTGPLESTFVDLSANAAGTYTVVDLVFTPKAQGVYVMLIPSSSVTGNFGDADTGQITYLKDFLIELVYEEDATLGYGAWFSGANANGTGLTVSWNGTANASASIGTGTDILTTGGTKQVVYTGPPVAGGSIGITTLTTATLIVAAPGVTANQAVSVNPSIPVTPTVTLNIDSANGLMHISANAADGAASNKTVYFDIFRNGVRIVTGLRPDATTRIATYDDTPGHAVAATYVIRAYDNAGGYLDQSTGTVTGS
jgi:hypothetical protein